MGTTQECYLEQIMETAPHKTTAVRPLTSHLKTHSSKTNKTRRTLLEKQGRAGCNTRSLS